MSEEKTESTTKAPYQRKPRRRPGPLAGQVDGEADVLSAIAAMPEPYRAMGERLHAIVQASAPSLTPKT